MMSSKLFLGSSDWDFFWCWWVRYRQI